MIKKYNAMQINELKKILIRKGFKVSKLHKKTGIKEIRSIYITSAFSLLIISFFFILPTASNLI